MQGITQLPDQERRLRPGDDSAQLLISVMKQTIRNNPAAAGKFLDTLRAAARLFVDILNASEPEVSFRQAAEFSLMARAHRRPSTLADLRSYINRMCRYKTFASKSIRSLTIPECREMLNDCFGHSVHTFRKAQSVLHSIFNHAERQGWCTENPARGILRPPVVEKRVEILTLSQIHALLNACHANTKLTCMEPAVRLMLWCGIRPTEVRRLSWSDIDPEEMEVYVDGLHSKTGGARAIPLRGGAFRLAGIAAESKGLIAPANWEHLWQLVRQEAGFTTWQNDALRHTFASMHLKRFHNLPLLQEEMGHRNAALLQTRYLNLRNLRKQHAALFFQHTRWP